MWQWLREIRFAKDDENPVYHPELVSGSQKMQGQEIPKQVRDDSCRVGIAHHKRPGTVGNAHPTL